MALPRRPLGVFPSPPDKRDRPAASILRAGPVPLTSNNTLLVPTILDQEAYPTCVSNAGFLAVRADQIQQGAKNPPFGSRLFTHFFARRTHGAEYDKDSGTYVRAFFDVINKLGFPPENKWSYDEPISREPNFAAIRAAYDQKKPTAYYRILETGSARVDAVKRALAAGNLVVFGTGIDDAFFDVKGEVVSVPKQAIVGNHAMCLVDHQGDVFRVANSWGTSWGVKGFWSMAADYVAWDGSWDFWICTSAPKFSE